MFSSAKILPLSQNWKNILKTLSHHRGGVMMTRSVLLGKHVKDNPFWFQVLIMPWNTDTTEAEFAALPFDKFTVSSWFTPSCTPSTSAFQKHQQQNWSVSQGHLVQRNLDFRSEGQGISANAAMPSELGVTKISAPQLCLGPALLLGMPYSLRITLHVKHLKKFSRYLEGTLYPRTSLVEKKRDLLLLKSEREIPHKKVTCLCITHKMPCHGIPWFLCHVMS